MNIADINKQETRDPKVSVVIPVYNTGKYVREAIESIMTQTLKELEIIVVNDGSTDNSQEIIDELAGMDGRVKVYKQENKGLSLARDAGMEQAHGTYIYFMDSDDLLEADALEVCYGKCEKERLDFVFFDAVCFYEGNVGNAPPFSYNRTDKLENKVYTGSEALKAQLQHRTYTPSACLSVIRTAFLSERHLSFYPGIVHEDQLFTTLLYLQAQRTACVPRSFFHRRVRESSIMTSKFSLRNLNGYFTVTEGILNYREQALNPETRDIIDLYLSQMLNAVMWQAHTLPLAQRLRLTALCLSKYNRYVSTRTIGVLLFKSLKLKMKA